MTCLLSWYQFTVPRQQVFCKRQYCKQIIHRYFFYFLGKELIIFFTTLSSWFDSLILFFCLCNFHRVFSIANLPDFYPILSFEGRYWVNSARPRKEYSCLLIIIPSVALYNHDKFGFRNYCSSCIEVSAISALYLYIYLEIMFPHAGIIYTNN